MYAICAQQAARSQKFEGELVCHKNAIVRVFLESLNRFWGRLTPVAGLASSAIQNAVVEPYTQVTRVLQDWRRTKHEGSMRSVHFTAMQYCLCCHRPSGSITAALTGSNVSLYMLERILIVLHVTQLVNGSFLRKRKIECVFGVSSAAPRVWWINAAFNQTHCRPWFGAVTTGASDPRRARTAVTEIWMLITLRLKPARPSTPALQSAVVQHRIRDF